MPKATSDQKSAVKITNESKAGGSATGVPGIAGGPPKISVLGDTTSVSSDQPSAAPLFPAPTGRSLELASKISQYRGFGYQGETLTKLAESGDAAAKLMTIVVPGSLASVTHDDKITYAVELAAEGYVDGLVALVLTEPTNPATYDSHRLAGYYLTLAAMDERFGRVASSRINKLAMNDSRFILAEAKQRAQQLQERIATLTKKP